MITDGDIYWKVIEFKIDANANKSANFENYTSWSPEIVVYQLCVRVSRGYTDHYQGRGHSIRPTATVINIHEHLI